ncbi:MAG: OmpA family protein [SAR324 cluster bacterium]|nr:OmpA family protein [SAR324 cluster bacterium]
MGQLIDEEECEVCVPFDQEWIFTYGDLVTLLLCFFILLFSMCKMDDQKIEQVSMSFKSMPMGSPFVFSGKSSVMENAAQKLEKLEMPDDVTVNVSNKGVEVTFKENVAFETNSVELTEVARITLKNMIPIISSFSNQVLVAGHADSEADTLTDYPSSWALSTARAASVADELEKSGLSPKRIQIAGYGDTRPRFYNDTAYKRALNRRVEVILLPEDYTR